jgi:homoserine dehydrogenase
VIVSDKTVVLKFGSSVLRSAGDLHIAVDEIYRHWRAGCRVLAVVSAFEDVTDSLMDEVMDTIGPDCPEATAAYVATGEQQTAALLLGSLHQYGLPARLVGPGHIALIAQGPLLESTPISVDVTVLDALWQIDPILVLPGYYGMDLEGRTALFGRGGSDLSALFLAAALGAECRLCKDVLGVYDADPASSKLAHRFSALSWERAIYVAGPLIQPKALTFAQAQALTFEVGRPNDAACTRVGHTHDEWAAAPDPSRPLRIALLGCGVVGRGVYETLKRYAQAFEVRHVLVRNVERYPDVENLTAEPSVVIDDGIDVVIACFGGVTLAYSLIAAALSAGKFVITANKAAIAAHGRTLARYMRGADRRLWYSAAVGGAMPAIETLVRLDSPVSEIRGIVNGTCGVILDAWAEGRTREEAIALAQAGGFAELDPTRDLSGLDSADKLSLLTEAAFREWIDPQSISTRGIDSITTDPTGYQLIARARRGAEGVTASVAPEASPPWSFLGQARGPENRLEIELETGEVIRLRAQGAGRWPTTVSVMADLHEIARLLETRRRLSDCTLPNPAA